MFKRSLFWETCFWERSLSKYSYIYIYIYIYIYMCVCVCVCVHASACEKEWGVRTNEEMMKGFKKIEMLFLIYLRWRCFCSIYPSPRTRRTWYGFQENIICNNFLYPDHLRFALSIAVSAVFGTKKRLLRELRQIREEEEEEKEEEEERNSRTKYKNKPRSQRA